MPSYELYTGPGCGSGDDEEEEEALNVANGRMLLAQRSLMDDVIQSKVPRMVLVIPYVFPSRFSNEEV